MYKVIIIDDNKLTADSLAKLSQWAENDCRVERVCYDSLSGKEAILLVQPDIIVSDIQLPSLNGLDVIEMLRSKTKMSKIIFISAHDNFKYAQRALQLGAHDYLLKPFSCAMLMNSVKEAIKQLSSSRTDQTHSPVVKQEYDMEGLCEQKLADPIMNYIRQRLDEHLTAEDVAFAFSMSTSRLDRLLRTSYKKGFRELCIDLRMKLAQELLADIRYNITEIGEKVGYGQYVSFYRAFLRSYGISPSEYREKLQKKDGLE